MTSKQLDKNFKSILQHIENYKQKYHSSADKINLIAVSKKHDINKILELYHLGQKDFGESYLQEALNKIEKINTINSINKLNKKNLIQINWHYIGPVQSNKTKLIAENFNWVHSIDRIKILERLNNQRPAELPNLNILLQINIDHDPNKSGLNIDNIDLFINDYLNIKNNLNKINLMGLMCILDKNNNTFNTQLESFTKLRELLNYINNKFELNMETLSIGMSNDYEAAIAAGGNMIRLGSCIFGQRVP